LQGNPRAFVSALRGLAACGIPLGSDCAKCGFLDASFCQSTGKATKLSDANGATIRGIHLMRGAGDAGGRSRGGTKENAMPKQGTWLRTAAAAAIASVSLSLSALSVAQANQRANATM